MCGGVRACVCECVYVYVCVCIYTYACLFYRKPYLVAKHYMLQYHILLTSLEFTDVYVPNEYKSTVNIIAVTKIMLNLIDVLDDSPFLYRKHVQYCVVHIRLKQHV